ncbi:MAG: 4a-hydroxytetrahydrobiopterin dehydratase [bacterium]|nr:4a-hydroxytetrahydrobiopterin dehydratase [bacterium]
MWKEINKALVQEYKFKDFKSALDFVNKIGKLAEKENHHPDIELGWGRVKVSISSHSEGKITEKDHQLSRLLDEL